MPRDSGRETGTRGRYGDEAARLGVRASTASRDAETTGAGRATAGRSSSATPGRVAADREGDAVDPAAVRRAIRDWAEAHRRRELRTALDRLDAHGSLTPDQRRIVGGMATAIVDGILAEVDAAMADPASADPETARAAIDLFDPEP